MKKLLLMFTLGHIASSCGQNHIGQRAFIIYSENVKDSFDIYVTLPKNYKANDQHSVFYYLDANIKSGNKIRELIRDSALKPSFEKTIFVGIGHIGDFHVLRRRDFTVPEVVGSDTFSVSKNFGHIDRFYQFMKVELIPYINNHYSTNIADNSLLGHSFGGLFTIYALFKSDTIFKNYYALSPSLWVSNYSIYNFNNLNNDLGSKRNLFVSAGSLEILNRIKVGTDRLEDFLKMKHYQSLYFEYKVYQGETHNSEVPYSIRDILCNK